MNDQNNNEQPKQDNQQPYQPYQSEGAESVPRAQSVPPYQSHQSDQQSSEPYQGEAQQPAQTYQTYQNEPQPYQTYQEPPVPPKKKSKWWIWLIIAGVILIAAAALLLFSDVGASLFGEKRPGNQAAWKAYDYFNTMEDKLNIIMSDTHKELSDRTNTEPFEAEGDFEIKSDLIKDIGYGIESFSSDFKVKYDLTDLGVQLDLLSLFGADIYLIEDEWVISFMGEAYASKLDINTDVDLKEEMPLKDRMDALNAFSSAGNVKELLERVMGELAPAIPDELTKAETVDVYSPLADKKVEMTALTTTLDQDDLHQIVVSFGENLEQNEDLLDDLQAFLDVIAKTSGENMDIDDIVKDMIEFDEDMIDQDYTLAFSVYEYKGETVGISFVFEIDSEDIEVFLITEYTGNTAYTSITMNVNGDEFLNVYIDTAYSDEDVDTDAVFTVTTPENEYTDSQAISLTLKGSTTVEKQNSAEYEFSGKYKIDMDLSDIVMMSSEQNDSMEFDVEFEGNCEFGDDLGTLKEDDDWNEIYDQEWGDIEDLMGALFNLGGATGDFGIGSIGDL